MKSLGNIRKVILASILTFTMGLSACTVKESENSNNEKETTEVEPKKELTPLEKEISELKDFQKTDKIYDNKDLEPYNLIQGYLYRVVKGRDESEVVELTGPDDKEAMQQLQTDGYQYIFEDTVVMPTYFSYDENDEKWYKLYHNHLNMKETTAPIRMDDKYRYTSDEELTELFGIDDSFVKKQFTLKK